MLREDGWSKVGQRGSHEQWEHPTKRGKVTVAGHDSIDAAPSTLNNILKQAGLR